METTKIEQIFSDEAFTNSILEMESPEEVQKALDEKGLSLSLEEIHAIKSSLSAADGELDEEDLESVSGGSVLAVISVIGAVAGLAGSTLGLAQKVNNWTRRRW